MPFAEASSMEKGLMLTGQDHVAMTGELGAKPRECLLQSEPVWFQPDDSSGNGRFQTGKALLSGFKVTLNNPNS